MTTRNTDERKLRTRLRRYERKLRDEKRQWGDYHDGAGEPGHLLCWSLALHRAGDERVAAKKLRQTMLSNLYLVPHLLGSPIPRLDIWHGSDRAEPDYLAHLPESYPLLWSESEREWAARLYGSVDFTAARERSVEIHAALAVTRPGPKRSRLVAELYELIR